MEMTVSCDLQAFERGKLVRVEWRKEEDAWRRLTNLHHNKNRAGEKGLGGKFSSSEEAIAW
jgi:hypothetical protein